ncbi:MAG: hypothetical protein Q9172_000290 [Xanthocarpia lactea]
MTGRQQVMDDFKSKLDVFLRPTEMQARWDSFVQRQETLYAAVGPGDAEGCQRNEDERECWNKLADVSNQLLDDRCDDKHTSKTRAWNIWMTARCVLLTAELETKYITNFHLCQELGDCVSRAKDAKKSFNEDGDPEWKDMDDSWHLCNEKRRQIFEHCFERNVSKAYDLFKNNKQLRCVELLLHIIADQNRAFLEHDWNDLPTNQVIWKIMFMARCHLLIARFHRSEQLSLRLGHRHREAEWALENKRFKYDCQREDLEEVESLCDEMRDKIAYECSKKGSHTDLEWNPCTTDT